MLKLRHLLLAGIALLTLTPVVAGGPAFAGGAPSQTYAEVGGWEVQYHPNTNRCSMMQTFGRGTDFFVGRDADGTWTFAFGNAAWSNRLQDRSRYQITMILDGYDKYTDAFDARSLPNGQVSLFYDNVSVDFLVSVMRRNFIDIYVTQTGERLTRLPLNNSAAAMLKLKECSDQLSPGQQQRPAPQRRIPEHTV